jgi:CRISPR-associated protein Cas2
MATVLACNDVSRDNTRARVAATLQVWGNRIQRNVYVITIDHDDLAELTQRLRELIDTRTDAVHLIPLCGTCWTGINVLGQATVDPARLYWAVL